MMQLCYYTKGGFSWWDVYSRMPIQLRRFYVRELKRLKEEEAKQIEEARDGKSSKQQDLTRGPKQNIKNKNPTNVSNDQMTDRAKKFHRKLINNNRGREQR